MRGLDVERSLASALLASLLACTTPVAFAPATGVLQADASGAGRLLLAVDGVGFGAPRSGSFRVLDCGRFEAGAFAVVRDQRGRALHVAGATGPGGATAWDDRRIVLSVPAELARAPGLSVQVCRSGGSVSAPVETWRYDAFEVPRSDPGTNPSPLALAIDSAGAVFVNEEFHTQVKALAPDGRWSVLDVPQRPGPGIFASTLFGDDPTRVATLGEAVMVDPHGRTWWTEAGATPYGGVHGNASRILRREPGAAALHVYTVPGDDGGVVGIAWDPARGRIWFTQARRATRLGRQEHVAQQARLTSFDPERIPPDDPAAASPAEACDVPTGEVVGACSATSGRRCLTDRDCFRAREVCAGGAADDTACFREHELPADFGVVVPGHLLRHSDGSFWYAAFWGGNHVGRFDPATGAFTRYPLPRPPGEADCPGDSCSCFFPEPDKPECPARCCRYRLLGRGPWMLAEALGGDVLFTTQEGGALSRFDHRRNTDPACTALDASGRNPCIGDTPIPGFDPARDAGHSLAIDAAGSVWITQGAGLDFVTSPGTHAPLAFLAPGAAHFTVLPPLSLFPFTSSGTECAPSGAPTAVVAAGVAIDPRTGAVWFADYCRKRIGRLVPLAP